MGKLLLNDKQVVVPGDMIAEGMDFVPASGTFREKDFIISERLGLLSVDKHLIRIIPFSGRYAPRKGDMIIGKVIDVTLMGWRLDTNSAYSALLSVKEGSSEYIERGEDLTKYFNIGDYVASQIINVTSQKLIDLTVKGPGLRKLDGGRIIQVSPSKVPRIIGKQGSMISMVKEGTGCRVIVGQNGIVWISGTPEGELKAVELIRKIESESHVSGLTDRIKEYIESNGMVLNQNKNQN